MKERQRKRSRTEVWQEEGGGKRRERKRGCCPQSAEEIMKRGQG